MERFTFRSAFADKMFCVYWNIYSSENDKRKYSNKICKFADVIIDAIILTIYLLARYNIFIKPAFERGLIVFKLSSIFLFLFFGSMKQEQKLEGKQIGTKIFVQLVPFFTHFIFNFAVLKFEELSMFADTNEHHYNARKATNFKNLLTMSIHIHVNHIDEHK